MIITESGCVVHKNVQFKEYKHAQSVYICDDCEVEFIVFEDACSGC